MGGEDTLAKIENVRVEEGEKRPVEEVRMEGVVVFVDPFEEFLRERGEREREVRVREEVRRRGGAEDERVTWTGKRVRGKGDGDGGGEGGVPGVGKYMAAAGGGKGTGEGEGEVLAEWESGEPVKKKPKAGGFGNFDAW